METSRTTRLSRVVAEYAISRVVHPAAWQIPLCRQDPSGGAAVNVVGTVSVFKAARVYRGQVEQVVYASSAAVFGPRQLYPPARCLTRLRPATYYGVYKIVDGETARVYWEEYRVPSVGPRPLTVYGPGRDVGVTADPTLAMKAAVLRRPFRIRWGGTTDFQYTRDVAAASIAAMRATLDGARVFNLHGESAAVSQVVAWIEEACPQARELISALDALRPLPAALNDGGLQRAVGPLAMTPLREGIRNDGGGVYPA